MGKQGALFGEDWRRAPGVGWGGVSPWDRGGASLVGAPVRGGGTDSLVRKDGAGRAGLQVETWVCGHVPGRAVPQLPGHLPGRGRLTPSSPTQAAAGWTPWSWRCAAPASCDSARAGRAATGSPGPRRTPRPPRSAACRPPPPPTTRTCSCEQPAGGVGPSPETGTPACGGPHHHALTLAITRGLLVWGRGTNAINVCCWAPEPQLQRRPPSRHSEPGSLNFSICNLG